MQLECFPTASRPPDIVPGRPGRGWMDAFSDRHPYRCLPMVMANSSGWDLLFPVGFTIDWTGEAHQHALTFTPDHPHPDFKDLVTSHFSRGIVTFHPGYLFRTPPGWSMWVSGSPNLIKDGIQPLTALVETDWLPFPFTMNWMMTRPGRVHFAKGEPFCFITLIQDKPLEQVQPVIRTMESDPVIQGQYNAWYKHREDFNRRLANRDPAAVRDAWQRFYFKGEIPEAEGQVTAGHVIRRRLKGTKLTP